MVAQPVHVQQLLKLKQQAVQQQKAIQPQAAQGPAAVQQKVLGLGDSHLWVYAKAKLAAGGEGPEQTRPLVAAQAFQRVASRRAGGASVVIPVGFSFVLKVNAVCDVTSEAEVLAGGWKGHGL